MKPVRKLARMSFLEKGSLDLETFQRGHCQPGRDYLTLGKIPVPLMRIFTLLFIFHSVAVITLSGSLRADGATNTGVGARPITGAEVILDGSRKLLDEKWT